MLMQIILIKKCSMFSNGISEVNNVQMGNSKDLVIVMPMYNLLEYSPAYSNSLWQYCKDIPAVDKNNAIVDFTDNTLIYSFNFKVSN